MDDVFTLKKGDVLKFDINVNFSLTTIDEVSLSKGEIEHYLSDCLHQFVANKYNLQRKERIKNV